MPKDKKKDKAEKDKKGSGKDKKEKSGKKKDKGGKSGSSKSQKSVERKASKKSSDGKKEKSESKKSLKSGDSKKDAAAKKSEGKSIKSSKSKGSVKDKKRTSKSSEPESEVRKTEGVTEPVGGAAEETPGQVPEISGVEEGGKKKHYHRHHHRDSEKKRKSSAKEPPETAEVKPATTQSSGHDQPVEKKESGPKKTRSKKLKSIEGKKSILKTQHSALEEAHIDKEILKHTVIGGDEEENPEELEEHLLVLEAVEKRKQHRLHEVAGEHTHLVNIRGQLQRVRPGHEKEFQKKPVPLRFKDVAQEPAVPTNFEGWPLSPFDMCASRLSPGMSAQSDKPVDRPHTINPSFFQREYDIGMLLNLRRAERSPWMRGQLPPDIEEKEHYLEWLRSRPKVPSDIRLEMERNSLSDRVNKMYQGRSVVQPAEHIADIYRQHSSGRLDPRSREELETQYGPRLRRESELVHAQKRRSEDLVTSSALPDINTYRQMTGKTEEEKPQAPPDKSRRDSNYFRTIQFQDASKLYSNQSNRKGSNECRVNDSRHLHEKIRRRSSELRAWANKMLNLG